MQASGNPALPRGLALTLGWRRLLFTVLFSLAIGLLISPAWTTGLASVLIRTVTLGLIGMLVFGLFEQWPKRLPTWLASVRPSAATAPVG